MRIDAMAVLHVDQEALAVGRATLLQRIARQIAGQA